MFLLLCAIVKVVEGREEDDFVEGANVDHDFEKLLPTFMRSLPAHSSQDLEKLEVLKPSFCGRDTDVSSEAIESNQAIQVM